MNANELIANRAMAIAGVILGDVVMRSSWVF
jgi:hypothetical protein